MRFDLNEVGGCPADIGIFATNLTDNAYRTGGFPLFNSVGVATTIFAEPRMWGVQLATASAPRELQRCGL